MRNARSLLLTITTGLAMTLAATFAARAAEPTAAGLWQKIEKGKTVGMFLVVDHSGIFEGVPSPFPATRYHSLVIAPGSVPQDLRVTATSEDGEIMAVQHRAHPVTGVQFHPESVLTEHGYRMIARFLGAPGARAETLPVGADGGLGLSAIGYQPSTEGLDRRGAPRAHEAPWYLLPTT